MSHYKVLAILPKNQRPTTEHDAQVILKPLLAPFDEALEVSPYVDEDGYETTCNPDTRFDYWQIGGRYSGMLTADGRDVFMLYELKQGWTVYGIMTPKAQWFSVGGDEWFDWRNYSSNVPRDARISAWRME